MNGEKEQLRTPYYLLCEKKLVANAKVMREVARRTGAKVLLAQKAFSNYALYPALMPYLDGTEASGLYEARLGYEACPGKEVHVFSAAYRADEIEEILRYADHIVFNSPAELSRYGVLANAMEKSVGLRINPECSTQKDHAIYDPCAPGSRLGTTRDAWEAALLETPTLAEMIDGIHFHTLCEQGAEDLEVTLDAVNKTFGDLLRTPRIKWVNFGGGHHITKEGYDLEKLDLCIAKAQGIWECDVYLEPGEAWALNAGVFVTRVLDIVTNKEEKIAVIDGSAACHAPDVIEMPYVPRVRGAFLQSGEEPDDTQAHRYRIAGPTCLSGDVFGEYVFDHPLAVGEEIVFEDMAIYTTVKNNTFNGQRLPAICVARADGTVETLKEFGYEDFKGRL